MSKRDRGAIINNLKVAVGGKKEEEYRALARRVFRNFAKYLVDFFRFKKIDKRYIERRVAIDGVEHLKSALDRGKGVILLSAHLGNWELGAAVVSKIGFPLSAVVMAHRNKKIDNFFSRQRAVGSVEPIPIGPSLKKVFYILKKNGCVALLGDRDFSVSGLRVKFFEKEALIPAGPASFSQATGSAIVPCFMIRKPDDSFRFTFDEPIYPSSRHRDTESLKGVIRKYLQVIERYVSAYPSQWFMFREVWNNSEKKSLRSHSII